MRNDLSGLKITEYTVSAPVKEELCFAFVSDLHHCENKPVLQAVKSILPDAVLVGGDFMHKGL